MKALIAGQRNVSPAASGPARLLLNCHAFLAKRASFRAAEPLLADAGYQGLAELHENCQTPFKKSKYHPLTVKEKLRNRSLARKRILIEHIFRKVKVFRILSEKYRNRRKRFSLRFNLIPAIYNFELNIK